MRSFFQKNQIKILIFILSLISISAFIYYYQNGLGLSYNDARSHLDIGRRVVEGLNPGLAQIGSVWLPLNHLLMIPMIWSDFMWHSGLAGAIQSMIAYIFTGVFIYLFLREIGAGVWGRLVGVAIFALNLNILYLQSTAMTEVLFIGTMTAGFYYSLLWYKKRQVKFLITTAFWIMLSTLIRYDGWFLFFFAVVSLFFYAWRMKDWRSLEGRVFLFCSLGGIGIILWVLWNLLIFGDPLYFALGPYSAHSQQKQLEAAGVLQTKSDWFFSSKVYLYAWAYNIGLSNFILAGIGTITLFFYKKIKRSLRFAFILLFAPLIFNILALYLGFSVLHITGLSGDTWFNIRYGAIMIPSSAIFIGFLVHALGKRWYFQMPLLLLIIVGNIFFILESEAVSIQDARFGASQKNVSEISEWLHENTGNENGLVLISAASHDSVMFSSGLPMKKFIHEGAGKYYEDTLKSPDHWARWIVMRTYSDDDSTWRAMKDSSDFTHYELVNHFPFADIYQLKSEYLENLTDMSMFD